jgi:hypothetical protein
MTGEELLKKHNELRIKVANAWSKLGQTHTNHGNPKNWLEVIDEYRKTVEELKDFLESPYCKMTVTAPITVNCVIRDVDAEQMLEKIKEHVERGNVK